MADKAFGVKQLNILGSGTPSIESPSDLNLNANKVAISTNLTVGGASTFTGNISANGNINANGNIIGDNATNISGINSVTATNFFGNISGVGATFTNITGTLQTASQTNITSVGTLGALTVSGNINANGNIVGDNATNISGINSVTATSLFGDGQKIEPRKIYPTTSALNINYKIPFVQSNDSYQIPYVDGSGFTYNPSTNVLTAGSFVGDGSGLTGIGTTSSDASFAQVEWDVVNNGASAYRFTGPGNDGAEDNPDLYLVRGQRYIFNVNASGHPFLIRSSNGVTYSDGVINNGAAVGRVILNLQHDAPARLFYQCSAHSGMIGNIYVVGGDQVISGVVTATTFSGNLTGTVNTAAQPNITSLGTLSSLSVTGNVSVGGTLTYDDVTNIDSVGLITARSGIRIGTGGTVGPAGSGIVTYFGDGSNLTGLPGFEADSNCNLIAGKDAGTCAGASPSTFNIIMGCGTGCFNGNGEHNVVLGTHSGKCAVGARRNVLIGMCAGTCVNNGKCNVYIGNYSGANQYCSDNIAMGCEALCGHSTASNNTGTLNISLGKASGKSICSGDNNVTIGCGAGMNLTSGTYNIFIGKGAAGTCTVTGSRNIVIGCDAGQKFTSTNNTIAIGYHAMGNAVNTSTNAIAIGPYAGRNLTSGQENIFIGQYTGKCTTDGGANIAIGNAAGCRNVSGINNIYIGKYSGSTQTAGNRNIAIGCVANFPVTDGSCQLVIGHESNRFFYGCCSGGRTLIGISTDYPDNAVGAALTSKLSVGIISAYQLYGDGSNLSNVGFTPDADENLVAGTQAGANLDGTNACFNILLGTCAGRCVTTGSNNVAIGNQALSLETVTGCQNVMIGFCAGKCTCSGSKNVFIGHYAGRCLKNNNGNVAIGPNAYVKGRGAGNVTLGSYTLGDDHTGSNNFIGGYHAGVNMKCGSSCNILLGGKAGTCLLCGSHNFIVGCCVNVPDGNGNCQLAFGVGSCHWITGDANFNIGIGTNRHDTVVGSAITAKLSVGILSAYQIFGDGSNLTGISAGFSPDSQENLYAGTSAGAASDADTCFNIGIGYSALASNCTGDYNVAFGSNAGNALTSGCWNVLLGMCSGLKLVGGSQHVFIGKLAGCSMTSGTYGSIFIGPEAGRKVARSNGLIAIGYEAACGGCIEQEELDHTVIIGSYAGHKLCKAHESVFIGCEVGMGATDTCSNFFVGESIAKCAPGKIGRGNVMVGKSLAHCLTTGYNNVVLGEFAAYALTTGYHHVFLGRSAGGNQIGGESNVFIGRYSGLPITTSSNNIAIGCRAGCWFTATDSNQLAIGHRCNQWISGNSDYNVGIGTTNAREKLHVVGVVSATSFFGATYYGDGSNLTGITAEGTGAIGGLTIKDEGVTVGTAGSVSTLDFVGGSVVAIASSGAAGVATITISSAGFSPDADENLVAGTCAGCNFDGTNACFNVYLGACAGKNTTGGSKNVSLGHRAGESGSGSGYGCNVSIGNEAGRSMTSSHNVSIGNFAAAYRGGGTDNVFLGRYSGSNNTGQTGSFNFGAGYTVLGGSGSGGCNIGLGCAAGQKVTDGSNNILLGSIAGKCLTTGDKNIAIGCAALAAATVTGDQNIAIGEGSSKNITSGSNNIALGANSLQCCMSTGLNNIAIGNQAGRKLQNNCNVAIGFGALCGSGGGVGNCNIAIGLNAGKKLTNGHANIFMGTSAGACITGSGSADGSYNIGFGRDALGGAADGGSTSGNFNAVMGHYSGRKISSGSSNTLMGRVAGCSITSGGNNIFLGSGSGKCVSTGSKNIAIGDNATPPSDTGSCQLIIGVASYSWMVGNSDFNVGIGTTNPNAPVGAGNTNKLSVGILSAYQLYGDGSNLTGLAGFSPDSDQNLIAGTDAGKCLTSGQACNNVFLGNAAGKYNTTVDKSVYLGKYAGCGTSGGCSGGYANFFGGYLAGGKITTGSGNIAIGCVALQNLTSGTSNVVIGDQAARNLTTPTANVIIGASAGFSIDTGTHNVFLGQTAGCNITSGDRNIAIGCRVCLPSATGDCQLAIGQHCCHWISGDSAFGVGIGTDHPTYCPITQNHRTFAVAGIVTAFKYYGDGSNLTGLAGFSADSQENLYAGTSAGASSDADTCFNIGIGYSAGNALNSGDDNILLGCKAGTRLTSGSANVVLGKLAGQCITSSLGNVIIGCKAACSSTSYSDGSVVIGKSAVMSMNSQTGVFIGAYAGQLGSGGGCSIHIGRTAGYMSSGNRNIFIGHYSGGKNQGGDENIFLGRRAGCNNTSGCYNIVLGCSVNVSSATAKCELAIGVAANIWICGDSCFNVGIGTNPGDAVGSATTSKLSVGILSAYQLYGDGSNLTGISGGGGLSHWTESANTSSPNNVVAANRLIATGAGTTIDAVIQPKSTGAFLTNLPDGAAAGGNKRGCYAVDLQMKRSGAGCVAAHNFATISGGENNYSDSTHAAIGGGYGNCAGWNAAVAGGYNNKAGGNAGAVGGGYGNCAGYMSFVGGGQYNNASGTYASVLGGGSNNASGSYSINIASGGSKSDGERSTVMGHNACTRNRDGSIAIGAHCGLANMGKAQYSIMNLGRSTTDATQTVLNSRSSSCAAGSDNQLTIPTNAAYVFCGSVIANVTSGGDTHGWLFRGVMKRGSGNASLVGTPSIDDVAYDSGASAWSIALGVDTTNQALAVCVTGQASTNITWVATVHATELQH